MRIIKLIYQQIIIAKLLRKTVKSKLENLWKILGSEEINNDSEAQEQAGRETPGYRGSRAFKLKIIAFGRAKKARQLRWENNS